MPKADPHRSFVTAWREYGEAWLTKDVDLAGPGDAWFKVCKGTRWWDDDRLPPEHPALQRRVKYKPPKRFPAKKPVSVRVLTLIGRDLVEWRSWATKDDSRPARHRDHEAEFHARIERELCELLEGTEWLTAA